MRCALDLETHATEFCADSFTASTLVHMNFFSDAEGVKDVDAKWIGWAGVNVPDEVGQRALTKALAEKVWLQLQLAISTTRGSIEQ